MTNLRKAADMALEALNSKYIVNCGAWMIQQDQAAEALRQALAEPEQEPVGFFSVNDYGNWEQNENGYGTPLYTALPISDYHEGWEDGFHFVGLTDEDMEALFLSEDRVCFARYIEAKLKDKNT